MSLLDTKVLPPLNGKYEAKVSSYREITNANGGYVEIKFQLPDRTYTYNAFPTQLDYLTSCLRNQLKPGEEATLAELLELAKETDINIYFSWNYDIGRMNVGFHEPANQTQEEAIEM